MGHGSGPPADPFFCFGEWLAEAREREAAWVEVMTLATAGEDGRPSARAVALTGWDQQGLVFFTDTRSRKARQVAARPAAAAVFLWPTRHQVRVEGTVAELSDAESDAGFESTPRQGRLVVWASAQDEVVPDREALKRRLAEVDARFAGGDPPRPPWWRAYRLTPATFEFWAAAEDALHDRFRYRRGGGGQWTVERLAP
jgi:pyridoxamine 5'-phosphate oxidase